MTMKMLDVPVSRWLPHRMPTTRCQAVRFGPFQKQCSATKRRAAVRGGIILPVGMYRSSVGSIQKRNFGSST